MPVNFSKGRVNLNLETVRRGFNPGKSKVAVKGIRVGADVATRRWQIERFERGMQKVNFTTAPPARLLNLAVSMLSIEELSTKKFGPKQQPVLYSGPLVNGLPTGLKQELANIVGRANKRMAEKKPEILTSGEINYLRKNLPNVSARLKQYLSHNP